MTVFVKKINQKRIQKCILKKYCDFYHKYRVILSIFLLLINVNLYNYIVSVILV